MKRVYAIIQDYFAFSRTEMRGLLVLLCLTFAGLWLPTLLRQAQPAEAITSQQDWQTLDSLVALWETAPTLSPTERPAFQKTIFKKEIVLTPFDPNQASEETLTALGFPTWIAERIVKYHNKGGKFRIKQDLQKIYGLSSEDYQRVQDYILLPDVLPQKTSAKASAAPRDAASSYPKKPAITLQPASLDINTADTAQLRQVPGIGTKLSARIVKYRQQLGGFHSLAQLQEIYHITDDGLANLNQYGVVQLETVQKINVNEADVPRLARHPYISWPLAKAIIAHREDYGPFTTLEDVKEVYLMDEILFEKLAPYWVI